MLVVPAGVVNVWAPDLGWSHLQQAAQVDRQGGNKTCLEPCSAQAQRSIEQQTRCVGMRADEARRVCGRELMRQLQVAAATPSCKVWLKLFAAGWTYVFTRRHALPLSPCNSRSLFEAAHQCRARRQPFRACAAQTVQVSP